VLVLALAQSGDLLVVQNGQVVSQSSELDVRRGDISRSGYSVGNAAKPVAPNLSQCMNGTLFPVIQPQMCFVCRRAHYLKLFHRIQHLVVST
jgi:hypothetical protein